jgi:hypothetical protein
VEDQAPALGDLRFERAPNETLRRTSVQGTKEVAVRRWQIVVLEGLVIAVRSIVLTALGIALFCATLAGLMYGVYRMVRLIF